MTIEYHRPNKYIKERDRTDLKSIDPILQNYIIPREIQFDTNVIDNDLPYFLKCKGSKNSIAFTVPTGALKVGNSDYLQSIFKFFLFSI